MPRLRWFALTALIGLGLSVSLAGCALLTPLPRESGLDDRLARFPTGGLAGLERPVTIHWDAHQVPFIEAETDADLAFALGLVHAHLRLGQMEVLRRVSAGRLSEMGGPPARDIDHALRLLDLGRAVPAILADMPEDSRAWLDAFVAGVNHYQGTVRPLPHEFTVLGLDREPWTPEDVLRIGRLASVDVNWVVWFQLLRQRDREDWSALWARLQDTHAAPSLFAEGDPLAPLAELLLGTGKSGSNAYAIAGDRSREGTGALIAADPHLGTNLPNLWLIAGYRSPSHHAVGLMIPGIPFVAVGRNPDIAWGGTNLRSANSDLFDVGDLPDDQIATRTDRIGVRWWFDRTVELRETPVGPLITDAAVIADAANGERLALRWVGHDPSDELTAMLRLNRARNWEEFRAALDGFAISAQTMVYADRDGNIGRVTATHLPSRPAQATLDIIQPLTAAVAWDSIVTGRDLPARFNPPEGFVASANNRPEDPAPVAIGYVFSADDRIARLRELLGNGPVGVEDLAAFQRDVFQRSAVVLRDAWLARLAEAGAAPDATAARALLERMAGWDGRYEAESTGALAFELTLYHFVQAHYGDGRFAAYQAGANPLALIAQDVAADPAEAVAASLLPALTAAAGDFDGFGTWGEMHRLGLAHPLSFLPLIGGRYRFADVPAAGTSETLMKTAHSLTNERHFTRFGSQARHISDLSDPDRNWFVLLGGQDGWFNSSTFLDQFGLWQAGEYVQVPLRPETARANAHRTMSLTPR